MTSQSIHSYSTPLLDTRALEDRPVRACFLRSHGMAYFQPINTVIAKLGLKCKKNQ